MIRFFALALLMVALPCLARAQTAPLVMDDGPPISITSPDTGSTFVYGSLKSRALVWDKRNHLLIARVTYTDADLLDNNSPQEDTMEFRLPGVTFDAAKGVFSATTAKGEVIPVAHMKTVLFVKSIEVLPNARVRVIREHGSVTVVLEAISPNDPAMHPAPGNPGGERSVGFRELFQ